MAASAPSSPRQQDTEFLARLEDAEARERDRGNTKAVGFLAKPAKSSVWDEVHAKYAKARAIINTERRANAQGDLLKGFAGTGTASSWRSLTSVKELPRARTSQHPSGTRSARTGDSASRASTSLTVRSAIQIRADRAFKEGFLNPDGPLTARPKEVAKWLDTAPLDAEGGKRGIGKDTTRLWKGKLREIVPAASKGDPIANNALSREGLRHGTPLGFFAQVPERLGQWREDFGKLDAVGTESSGGTFGQWVPEAVVRRKEIEQRRREAKLKAAREAAVREEAEAKVREAAAREREAAARRAERDAEAAKRAEREAAERVAAEKRRLKAEARKKREEAFARMAGGGGGGG